MLEFNEFNFDADGDGIPDSIATEDDLNGDGAIDALTVTMDTDGDSVLDTVVSQADLDGDGNVDTVITLIDANGDGQGDTLYIEQDTDGNGEIDSVSVSTDENGDGVLDVTESLTDANGDGATDAYSIDLDTNGDGQTDIFGLAVDNDGDGQADTYTEEQLIDTDGDGEADTFVSAVDVDGDGVFDAVEVYSYDPSTGTLELIPIDTENITYGQLKDFENFDPSEADPDGVIGDPESDMDEWEFQGDTNRCALYSQKFVIEELTGNDIDIDEMAEIAEENGWFTEEGGTPLVDMNKMLEYYGVENEMSFDNTVEDIAECLENGGKVIVSVDSDEIWYGDADELYAPGEAPDHAVEVIGIDNSDPDNPMVILNDSGHPDGCGAMIPLDEFVRAWEDGGCQMIACE